MAAEFARGAIAQGIGNSRQLNAAVISTSGSGATPNLRL